MYNSPLEVLDQTCESIQVALDNLSNEFQALPWKVCILSNNPSSLKRNAVREFCSARRLDFIEADENKGFGSGHNTIFCSYPEVTWYICCNPDVVLDPRCLIELLRFSFSQPQHCLYMPKVLNLDGTHQPVVRPYLSVSSWVRRQFWRIGIRSRSSIESTFDYSRSAPIEFVSGCFFLIEASKYRSLGGFDEKFFLYYEDADLSKRAESLGGGYFVSGSKINHAWGKGWKTSPRLAWVQLKSLARYLWKHR